MQFEHFTLSQWLDYLENVHREEIQLGLSRITIVAKKLDLLNPKPQVITVAGTNGKGSTVSCLEAIYRAAGYEVGSYTSPHLLQFNERIRVNGVSIADADLCSAFLAIEQGRGETPLTYFEMTTLAALWHFKHYPLAVLILEVGMGGRLDATNIIANQLSIITTIDLDHQDFLGDTREAIGFEKAGIMRPGTVCVYGDIDPPQSIINAASIQGTKLLRLDKEYSVGLVDGLHVQIAEKTLHLPFPGVHFKAAAAAIVASQCLQVVLPVAVESLSNAMEQVQIAGRQQIISAGPTTLVLDVAHNPQSVLLLADFLKNKTKGRVIHAVFSGLKDKDLYGLIKPMVPLVTHWYPTLLASKRAASRESLMHLLQGLMQAVDSVCQSICACFENPGLAYQAAKQSAQPGDFIVVYGSFLTVSAVMSTLSNFEQEELA